MKEVIGKKLVYLIFVLAVSITFAVPLWAQQSNDSNAASNPLVQLLESKGILTHMEAAQIETAGTPAEANQRLAALLLSKGLISKPEYDQTVAASFQTVATTGSGNAQLVPAVLRTNSAASAGPAAAEPPPPQEPSVIPAVAPVRVLPIGVPEPEKGNLPGLRLGSGGLLSPYGFIKASAVYDSTNSGGATFGSNDFPLPLLLGDTGPNAGSQFRVKARSARFGGNFYYPLSGPDVTLTGRIEMDFEGDYTLVNNRNVSSIRSSQVSLRLAWLRLDTKIGSVPWFVQFGQDWTILGSSTLPDYYETTGLGVFFGSFYERLPMIRTGVQFKAGNLKIQPEFALVLPSFADANLQSAIPISVASVPTTTVLSGVGEELQSRFGARIGSDSGQPGEQARIVLDYPLFHRPGVSSAELILSGGHARGTEIVLRGALPSTVIAGTTNCATPPCSIGTAFPTGVQTSYDQNAFSAEFQLPTPWVTAVGKYYRGGDLRFYFAGQTQSTFTDRLGQPASVGEAFALSGNTIQFVNIGGVITVAPPRPIRGYGGFVQLGFPLSRIFGAEAAGRNAGWSAFVDYGTDRTLATDTIRLGGNGLLRSDYFAGSLRYKINKWATIIHEVTYYDTRDADCSLGPPTVRTKLWSGRQVCTAHDWRNEFGTIFTF